MLNRNYYMNGQKESEPRGIQGKEPFVPMSDLYGALKDVPTPLRDKILNSLTIMEVPVEEAEKFVETDQPLDPDVADEFLDQVSRNVFGFTIEDLSPDEKREILRIKKELKI